MHTRTHTHHERERNSYTQTQTNTQSLSRRNEYARTHTHSQRFSSLSITHTHTHTYTTGLALNAVHTKSKKLSQARQHTLFLDFSLFIYPTLSHDSLPSHTHNHSLPLSHISQTPATHQPTSHTKHTSTQYLSMSEPIAYRNESLA